MGLQYLSAIELCRTGRSLWNQHLIQRSATATAQMAEGSPASPMEHARHIETKLGRKIKMPDAGRRGHRDEGVPGNEGVGEHVRTRFHAGLLAR
jgi:hypothetical protein